MKSILVIILLIFALFLVWLGYSLIGQPVNTGVLLEEEISNLRFSTLSGNVASINDFGQKPLILVSWVTYNSYCQDELAILSRISEEFGDRVEIVAINSGERKEVIDAFMRENPVSQGISVWIDLEDNFHQTLIGRVYPELVFIDSNGIITSHERGFLDEAGIRRRLGSIIESQ